MLAVDLTTAAELYRKYADDLAAVRDEQRRRLPGIRAQLDDVEAELTYLRLRELRPATVVEIGAFHGWSTTWLLSALRDNGFGELRSYDVVDHVLRSVPAELAGDRWTFVRGDARKAQLPVDIDYLFLDAAHSARFARWYITELFGRLSGTPVSVHDVFHGRRPMPFSEGAVLVRWLTEQKIDYFTPSARRAPETFAALLAVKRELGLDVPVRSGRDNPMVFFEVA
ncbi:methyltransferase family protein [Kutzneria buriramensis]|uniref:Methyltransferase family protein n=1 Tax=Kutzneria buriramensis TaxID=1045776 RepID=A0A3E0H6Y4_9PSEU|nr:methyltransferase family protein [Kutzneria buriramensis]